MTSTYSESAALCPVTHIHASLTFLQHEKLKVLVRDKFALLKKNFLTNGEHPYLDEITPSLFLIATNLWCIFEQTL